MNKILFFILWRATKFDQFYRMQTNEDPRGYPEKMAKKNYSH
jgi:hypothetical protein